jgi:hypothetical protein
VITDLLQLKLHRLRVRLEAFDFKLRLDALSFAFYRADYYRYLADMIEGTQGAKSLLRIFQEDAVRDAGTAQGRLSARWAREFARGGHLGRAFEKTLPAADIAVIATAQEEGDEKALPQALKELADNTDLQRKAITIVISTMLASLLGLTGLLSMLFLMPAVMVPKIKDAFSMVPPEDWPITAARLFKFADAISASWIWILISLIALVSVCIWSLGTVTGPVRMFLNKYGMAWAMYRDFQSIRMLSSLATAINPQTSAKSLRDGLAMQLPGASRWKRFHLEQMLAYVDSGTDNSMIFTTGTLDRRTEWYLCKVVDARGIDDALGFAKSRLETQIIKKLTVQSLVISWVLILMAILASIGMMLWVYAALDALAAAQQNLFY